MLGVSNCKNDDSASYLGTKGYCVATCEPSFYNL